MKARVNINSGEDENKWVGWGKALGVGEIERACVWGGLLDAQGLGPGL